jgi:hypothetical protein
MLPSLKRFLWIALLASGMQGAWAFSLLGPAANGGDNWQVEAIAYNPIPGNIGAPPFFIDSLATGPKNLGEEYRRNTTTMYYACDANFLDYFGSNGLAAVDQAFVILNNVFTNNPTGMTNGLDGYSSDLSEIPLNTLSESFQSGALGLLDLKSETLQLMVEQLGLADAVRYVWALHNRFQPGNTTCPDQTTYQVIMRNFDIVNSPLNQPQYSPYINGSLYTYFIDEICSSPAAPPNADALEILIDPLVNNPPVSSSGEDNLSVGFFYDGLTRDDVAGLRYLLSSNNINTEAVATGSLLLTTNVSTPIVITTLPLSLLSQATTLDPVTLLALPNFAGLVISSVVTNFSFGTTTNVTTSLQSPPIGSPAGTPAIQVTVTNLIPYTLVTNYTYTFANIFTNSFTTNSTITTQTISTSSLIGAPAGSPAVTNIVTTASSTHVLNGDFFIVPSNWCGFIVVTSSPPQKTFFTNVVFAAGSTNQFGIAQFTLITITSFTNRVLVIDPEFCVTSNATSELREGIQKIQFTRANFDSLIGQFFQPITNNYSMTVITNSQLKIEYLQRIVTTPDLVFSAADLLPGPAAVNTLDPRYVRTVNFDQSNIGAGLAGPGVINPSSTITYNKVGPVLLNKGTAFLNQANATQGFLWGSLDESTNDPVVYPNGTSIQNLANQVLIQISPTSLPNGTNGVAYVPTTFTTTGGAFTLPYTWALPTSSGPLPSGLTLSSGGTISGTPTQSGTFDFVIQLTDSLGRAVQWSYSIKIN